MKNFGICLLSLVPMRKEPMEKAEMVSQILYGELVEVLENKKGWLSVRMCFDGYTGWVSERQLHRIDRKAFEQYLRSWTFASTDLIGYVKEDTQKLRFPVTAGASFPRMLRANFIVGSFRYSFDGKMNKPHEKPDRRKLIGIARKFLGAPYLWGGRSPLGLDCSGFVQIVYKMNNIAIKRDAWQQALEGESLSFPEEALPGDLAFFDDEEGKVVHVGIMLGKGKIIHAAGQVRIDKLDHHGIFREDDKKYTHKLRMIKRILPG